MSTKSKTPKVLSKSSKYIFTLKNINTDIIDKKYGIILESNISSISEQPINTTKISELSINKNKPEIISFLDESKKEHKCTVSMIDFKSRLEIRTLRYDCFWDHQPIPSDIIAIGCPIKFVPSQVTKKYYSEISKDNYIIKENITLTDDKKKEISNDNRLQIIEKEYYLTDGAFCSFNCAMAYAEHNKNNSMYSLSPMLLLKMYNDNYNHKVPVILSAPSFRILKEYGGHIDIVKFRASFNKIDYVDHGFITDIPDCKSVGTIYEEMIKF
jgi:hypothetical protein